MQQRFNKRQVKTVLKYGGQQLPVNDSFQKIDYELKTDMKKRKVTPQAQRSNVLTKNHSAFKSAQIYEPTRPPHHQ